MRRADVKVVWWCTTEKFGGGGGGFNPGFGETDVRFTTIDYQSGQRVRQSRG